MLKRIISLVVGPVSLACLAGCEVPTQDVAYAEGSPVVRPSNTVIVGGTYVAVRVGEEVSYTELSEKSVAMASTGDPVQLVSNTGFRCEYEGHGGVTVTYTDNTTQMYSVNCIGPIVLQVGYEMHIGSHFVVPLSWIVQADGLVDIREEYGDFFMTCVQPGEGTLWVAFADAGTDFYDLVCLPN